MLIRSPFQRNQRVTSVVSLCERDRTAFERLPKAERLAVTIVLDRPEWLLPDGFYSIHDARDHLAPEWDIACRNVIAQRDFQVHD